MKELFVPYNIAVALKDAGFREPCIQWGDLWGHDRREFVDGSTYDYESFYLKKFKDVVLYPTYDQVIDWFEKKHNIFVSWSVGDYGIFNAKILTFADDNQEAVKNWWDDNHLFDERKDALDRGILKAIELIKQQGDRC